MFSEHKEWLYVYNIICIVIFYKINYNKYIYNIIKNNSTITLFISHYFVVSGQIVTFIVLKLGLTWRVNPGPG